jgi:hypothetical protein
MCSGSRGGEIWRDFSLTDSAREHLFTLKRLKIREPLFAEEFDRLECCRCPLLKTGMLKRRLGEIIKPLRTAVVRLHLLCSSAGNFRPSTCSVIGWFTKADVGLWWVLCCHEIERSGHPGIRLGILVLPLGRLTDSNLCMIILLKVLPIKTSLVNDGRGIKYHCKGGSESIGKGEREGDWKQTLGI